MITILSVLLWIIWSIHAAKALVLAGLLACVVNSTIIMLRIIKPNIKKSVYLFMWLMDMLFTFWTMFFKIPTNFKKFTQYFICLGVLFICFCIMLA